MNNKWTEQYPNNLNSEIDCIDDSTVTDLLESAVNKFSSNTAFYSLNTSIDYKMTSLLSKRIAAYLQYLGVTKDTKVAIMLPNLLTYPITLFGSYYCGATVVNINPMYKSREINDILIDSEAEYIFVLDKFYQELQPCIPTSKLKKIIVCKITDLLSPFMRIVIPIVMLYKKQSVSIKKQNNIVFFKDIISNNFSFEDILIDENDIALLQYTGGTTGKSKAAILTHKNLLSNVQQVSNWIEPHIKQGQEIIITALPLFHIFSFTVNCLTFLKLGSENVLIANPRDLDSFIKVLSKKKFTVITAVNTLFNLLLTSRKFRDLDFSNFKFSVGGGMAVLSDTAKKWRGVTGTNITQGYGLTETSPVVAINRIDDPFNGYIGLPVQSTKIKIIDDDENILGCNQAGELCVQGPQVMSGYWKISNEKNKYFTDDGFFKTGDIATMNDEGYLKIVDRKKDMIISSGYNVYPNELEDYLATHPDILEAGVIGVDDKNRGEYIKAFVVSKNESLSSSDIIAFCKNGLTEYKVPKRIIFIKELPKTNVGKILRRKLRELN
jgi:long-chain acyl-CoA synthetase|tara:strand:+ start:357 stop:2009 length:1653 start_codon:yes stop_codon:yes gene_type:complete